MKLGGHEIGPGRAPYFLAEVGVNHGGDLARAKRLIESAARGGAHCAKFQAYKADKLAAEDSPAYWDRALGPQEETQRALFAKYDGFGPEDYFELRAHCQEVGIDFACTPFDLDAVEMLDPLVTFHKIASADLTNVPLLRAVARKGKPVLLSTGASTLVEIETALRTIWREGCEDVVLMHCMLAYPCKPEDANLRMLNRLREVWPMVPVGYSDHCRTDGELDACLVAALLGAEVIEKHFTDARYEPGNDHFHSADEGDMRMFGRKLRTLSRYLGSDDGRGGECFPCEAPARLNARRSLYAARDIPVGKVVEAADLIALRPGGGIDPEHWDDLVGARASRAFKAGDRFEGFLFFGAEVA